MSKNVLLNVPVFEWILLTNMWKVFSLSNIEQQKHNSVSIKIINDYHSVLNLKTNENEYTDCFNLRKSTHLIFEST